MGVIEDIDALDLSDEVKASLKQSHQVEIGKLSTEVTDLRRKSRVDKVEEEIAQFSEMGIGPGAAKYVRQVFLSDDENPAAVMLSDDDLGLTGEQATGTTARKEITVSDALREFISRLPKKGDGKLAFADQLVEPAGGVEVRPVEDEDSPEAQRDSLADSLSARTGFDSKTRTRSRYSGGAQAPVGGVN